ncbi:MAG TPA: LamG domain-containing protein [Methanoregula sp.]|nr:LamG domain-containing protein [Methanoregula sp.]
MSILHFPWGMRSYTVFLLFLLVLICGVPVYAQDQGSAPEPAVYLNFNEGSGLYALDGSGQGNAAAIHNVSRIDGGGCGRALSFSNPDSYVAIPFRVLNHPSKEITVSTWFYIDNFTPATLVSCYHNGGYRLGFDDGNDLWWTLNFGNARDVSVSVQHENIVPGQWHQVTGTYDGTAMKIYLDGILRNQANATGLIHYEDDNYIILGADGSASDTPGVCPHYFTGGLDEVRIYPVALTYSQVMDDRFRCMEGEWVLPVVFPAKTATKPCESVSGSVRLGTNETAIRVLSFSDKSVNGTWQVSLQPGSLLSVQAHDSYMGTQPDAWYLEIAEGQGKPARTIAFPNRNNAPAEAVVRSGNATVTVRYFSGGERFPATVVLRLESHPPAHPPPIMPQNILENPIIVIYSASWATLVAILLVMIWLQWRKKTSKTAAGEPEDPPRKG